MFYLILFFKTTYFGIGVSVIEINTDIVKTLFSHIYLYFSWQFIRDSLFATNVWYRCTESENEFCNTATFEVIYAWHLAVTCPNSDVKHLATVENQRSIVMQINLNGLIW